VPGRLGLEMHGSRVPFEDAFHSVKVRFGHTSERHIFRSSELRRRQQPGVFAAVESTTVSDSTGATNVIALEAPTATAAFYNLSGQVFNQSIQVLPIVSLGLPIAFSCDNCSSYGTLEVTNGDFDIDLKNVLHDRHGLGFINDGFVELLAQGFGAHVELSASPSLSGSFNVPLPTLPFPFVGFAVGCSHFDSTYDKL
jgi:hypothetical protein